MAHNYLKKMDQAKIPYMTYFYIELIGSILIAVFAIILMTVYVLFPIFNGYEDIYYNIRSLIKLIVPHAENVLKPTARRVATPTDDNNNSVNENDDSDSDGCDEVEEETVKVAITNNGANDNDNGNDDDDDDDDDDGSHKMNKYKTKLYGYTLQEWYLMFMLIITYFIIVVVVVIFWLNFFIERSTSCSPYNDGNFHCYNANLFLNERLHSFPLNCSEKIHRNVICYKFACNISGGGGLATGAFGLAWFLANALIWFIIQIAEPIIKKDNNNNNNCCKFNVDCKSLKGCFKKIQELSCYVYFAVMILVGFQFLIIVVFLIPFIYTIVLYAKGVIPAICFYEVSIFCFLVLGLSATFFWCIGFKKYRCRKPRKHVEADELTVIFVKTSIET